MGVMTIPALILAPVFVHIDPRWIKLGGYRGATFMTGAAHLGALRLACAHITRGRHVTVRNLVTLDTLDSRVVRDNLNVFNIPMTGGALRGSVSQSRIVW